MRRAYHVPHHRQSVSAKSQRNLRSFPREKNVRRFASFLGAIPPIYIYIQLNLNYKKR